jgi:hypothetical protein
MLNATLFTCLENDGLNIIFEKTKRQRPPILWQSNMLEYTLLHQPIIFQCDDCTHFAQQVKNYQKKASETRGLC